MCCSKPVVMTITRIMSFGTRDVPRVWPFLGESAYLAVPPCISGITPEENPMMSFWATPLRTPFSKHQNQTPLRDFFDG